MQKNKCFLEHALMQLPHPWGPIGKLAEKPRYLVIEL